MDKNKNIKTLFLDGNIKLALQWFKDNDIPANEDDGSIYVSVGEGIEVQISTAEIDWRADQQINQS
jgi:hypothetical protein